LRAVLDPNVLISALLTPAGAPARVLLAWLEGAFELVVSPLLLAELERALAYPKIAERVEPAEAAELIALLHRQADVSNDPLAPPRIHAPDADDDYLIALAEAARAVIVSGDAHLLGLADRLPVYSPAEFLTHLGDQ
jgi:uncharacterized protein